MDSVPAFFSPILPFTFANTGFDGFNDSPVCNRGVNRSGGESVNFIYDSLFASRVDPIEECDNLADVHWRVIGGNLEVIGVIPANKDID